MRCSSQRLKIVQMRFNIAHKEVKFDPKMTQVPSLKMLKGNWTARSVLEGFFLESRLGQVLRFFFGSWAVLGSSFEFFEPSGVF